MPLPSIVPLSLSFLLQRGGEQTSELEPATWPAMRARACQLPQHWLVHRSHAGARPPQTVTENAIEPAGRAARALN